MADKPDIVARMALAISLTTAIFSVYQWWNGENESKIKAAIEISRNYDQNKDLAKGFLDLENVAISDASTFSTEIGDYLSHIEYIALLANSDHVDSRYLSEKVKCEIKMSYIALQKLRQRFKFARPEVDHFAQKISQSVCLNG